MVWDAKLCPFPGEAQGNSSQRREAAKGILAYMVEKIEVYSSYEHWSAGWRGHYSRTDFFKQYDGGVLLCRVMPLGLGHRIVSKLIGLREIYQAFMWQDLLVKEKNGAKLRHLMALDTAMAIFPDAKIVMTTAIQFLPYRLIAAWVDTLSHGVWGNYSCHGWGILVWKIKPMDDSYVGAFKVTRGKISWM